jgi:hypothetical protein
MVLCSPDWRAKYGNHPADAPSRTQVEIATA